MIYLYLVPAEHDVEEVVLNGNSRGDAHALHIGHPETAYEQPVEQMTARKTNPNYFKQNLEKQTKHKFPKQELRLACGIFQGGENVASYLFLILILYDFFLNRDRFTKVVVRVILAGVGVGSSHDSPPEPKVYPLIYFCLKVVANPVRGVY